MLIEFSKLLVLGQAPRRLIASAKKPLLLFRTDYLSTKRRSRNNFNNSLVFLFIFCVVATVCYAFVATPWRRKKVLRQSLNLISCTFLSFFSSDNKIVIILIYNLGRKKSQVSWTETTIFWKFHSLKYAMNILLLTCCLF